jgi:ABC-type uncharacterized transport system YnjBCD ATPase subunit
MPIDYSIGHPVQLEVNFEVEGFTILLGQSGEGKTTLLRAVAGLLPTHGEPFGRLLPQQRAVGYLPQGYALFPHLRAWENVAQANVSPPRDAGKCARLRNDSAGVGLLVVALISCACGLPSRARLRAGLSARALTPLPAREQGGSSWKSCSLIPMCMAIVRERRPEH